MSAPGILIAAARSGSGKTTLALGLMRALTRRGMRVTAVKCGPDYIDPAFHAAATGCEGINLDSWAMEPGLIAALAARAGAEADIIIAEGAMGLFDGAPEGAGGTGASADIAALLGWPVLLAHDASGQAQTAGAVIRGLASHDPRVKIAGVVANRLGSDRHRRLVAESVAALGLPLFGALLRNDAVKLPERHLGLVQAGETEGLDARLNALADFVEAHVDVAAIVNAAASAPRALDASATPKPPARRIAVARDAAFSFFYPHHAQSWRAQGAELVFFSPLADEPPPQDADLCWLPGGYPELHAGALAQAENFLSGLRRFAQTKPVHGECGGYMVLGQLLTDADGRAHRMAGLLELETSFASRKLHLGYRIAALSADHCLGPKGRILRGHEFHYATVTREEGEAFALVRDAYSPTQSPSGRRAGLVSGTFFHVIG
ncbi:cobyrinate a,c-diamide synthase [Methylocystis iwaonis]|uniref:Hydrogenobyrinate a,c-diamide synthase n=1 Tax=Methylocystis iwaonis TaxID=2885079 RepID=A0ABN6VJ59_9HYPH|nr:cobyrinate a,c-diamide synthase [Methylocystis iwaonis]BDV35186.1 hydrogenobyrinate a,c-diamide synthase [Methylocystis iwaonis]